MAQIRANFLILTLLLVFTGLSTVYKFYPGEVEHGCLYALIITVGVVLSHISVNLFNEYSDYNTNIDFITERTPFSGGSGMLVRGETSPRAVLTAAVVCLAIAFVTGLYFTFVSHWTIMAIALFGTLTIVLYTPVLVKFMLGELFSGITLGSLVVIGTYIAMTATPSEAFTELAPLPVILISLPSGILTSLLLLLNEFPDVEADKKGGRKHLVIRFGKQKAAWIYAAGIFVTFLIIAIIPILGYVSPWFFIALSTLPLAVKAAVIAIRNSENPEKIVTAMGLNVFTVLATNLLIAVGVLV